MEFLDNKLKKRKRFFKHKINFKLLFFVISAILFGAFEIMTALAKPTLIALCKVKSQSLASSISAKVVEEVMSSIGYLDLITLDRDENGSILALRANVIEMNKLSSKISSLIQAKYSNLDEMYIKIPIGNFIGNELLAGLGPRIVVKIIPAGTVSTDYKTEFLSTGINQTRHRIYIEIKSSMTVVAPFTNESINVVTNVNVAETVLIGNVPDTFYNLQGIGTDVKENATDLIK